MGSLDSASFKAYDTEAHMPLKAHLEASALPFQRWVEAGGPVNPPAKDPGSLEGWGSRGPTGPTGRMEPDGGRMQAASSEGASGLGSLRPEGSPVALVRAETHPQRHTRPPPHR